MVAANGRSLSHGTDRGLLAKKAEKLSTASCRHWWPSNNSHFYPHEARGKEL